jgi:CheY-like chemotaxis protein
MFARNGLEAVECYKKNCDINLVLMDMKMPEMDGYSATRIIKQINRRAVVIGQSAFALPGDKEKSFDAGCDGYLTKPLEKEQLFSTIRKIFNKNQPEKKHRVNTL